MLTYQWRKNGSNIVGQTVTSLDITGRGVGSYDCVITATNAAGAPTFTSPATVVSVPVITWGSTFTIVDTGGNTRKRTPSSVIIDGFPIPVLTYLWTINGSPAGTNASLTVAPIGVALNFQLTITATNDVGSDSEASAVINPW